MSEKLSFVIGLNSLFLGGILLPLLLMAYVAKKRGRWADALVGLTAIVIIPVSAYFILLETEYRPGGCSDWCGMLNLFLIIAYDGFLFLLGLIIILKSGFREHKELSKKDSKPHSKEASENTAGEMLDKIMEKDD